MTNKSRIAWLPLLGFLLVGVLLGCSEKETKWGPKNVNVTQSIQALKSDDKNARADAAAALASIGEAAAEAVPALTVALKDNDAEVRRLAAYALGEIGPKAASALPTLKTLMADSDRSVVTQTINSMRAIDSKSVGDLQIKNTTQ